MMSLLKAAKSTWFNCKEDLSMARRKRASVKNDQPIGVGLTTKADEAEETAQSRVSWLILNL